LNWFHENWEFAIGVATALTGAFFKVRQLMERQRKRLVDGIIDPYRPGIILTVSPRTGRLGDDVTDEDRAAFPITLGMLPDLHSLLSERVTTHDFSLRVIRRGRGGAMNAFFKLRKITKGDVAKMIQKIDRLEAKQQYAPTILLYRQFGIFLRFDIAKKPKDLHRLLDR
jgi:hypothetical protein